MSSTSISGKSTPRHSLVVSILLSFGAIIVMLILLEIGLRWIMPAPEPTRFSEHTGWRGNPHETKILNTDGYEHTLKLNSLGMHDTEHPFEKPADTYRILMLGDSFVEARQVTEDETAHQVLEDLLNESSTGKRYSVISAGVPAWGTSQQLLYYKSEGRLFEPDLVLLMFYLGNDVTDNLPVHGATFNGVTYYSPYFPICNGELDLNPWVYAPGVRPAVDACPAIQKWFAKQLHTLYWHSRIYSVLSPLINRLQSDFLHKDLPNIHLYVPQNNKVFREQFPRENKAIEYGWEVVFGVIEELQREVEADGAKLAVVLIDQADVIEVASLPPGEQEARAAALPYLMEARLDAPEQRFRQALSGRNLDLLNLQPLLVEHIIQNGERLYFPHDKHWNVAGNRVVAEILHNWLRNE